ncbi:MAG: PIN domain-containing protein [Treponema sp.]|nr:PIN domain-containing protein [Treponema sp.]
MRVFYDSNVILDILLNRTEFVTDSTAALKLSEIKKVKGFISVVSLTDIFYLVTKNLSDKSLAISKIQPLLEIVSIAKADRRVAEKALNSGWKDFEDAVQYYVAKKARCKCIVTRNKKDFRLSEIPVYTPTEFIKLF